MRSAANTRYTKWRWYWKFPHFRKHLQTSCLRKKSQSDF